MIVVKGIVLIGIFVMCIVLGFLFSKRYSARVYTLKQFKKAFSIFETKIRYTEDLLSNIFEEISEKIDGSVGELFLLVSTYMESELAGDAWIKGLKKQNLILTKEDYITLESLAKMLGTTDIDGQISQINLVQSFLDEQIEDAKLLQSKNEKMYKKLGIIAGMAICIVLV